MYCKTNIVDLESGPDVLEQKNSFKILSVYAKAVLFLNFDQMSGDVAYGLIFSFWLPLYMFHGFKFALQFAFVLYCRVYC